MSWIRSFYDKITTFNCYFCTPTQKLQRSSNGNDFICVFCNTEYTKNKNNGTLDPVEDYSNYYQQYKRYATPSISQKPHSRLSASSDTDGGILCRDCQHNQWLIVQIMSNFDVDEGLSEAEVEKHVRKYRRFLEAKYPLCSICCYKGTAKIDALDRKIKNRLMNSVAAASNCLIGSSNGGRIFMHPHSTKNCPCYVGMVLDGLLITVILGGVERFGFLSFYYWTINLMVLLILIPFCEGKLVYFLLTIAKFLCYFGVRNGAAFSSAFIGPNKPYLLPFAIDILYISFGAFSWMRSRASRNFASYSSMVASIISKPSRKLFSSAENFRGKEVEIENVFSKLTVDENNGNFCPSATGQRGNSPSIPTKTYQEQQQEELEEKLPLFKATSHKNYFNRTIPTKFPSDSGLESSINSLSFGGPQKNKEINKATQVDASLQNQNSLASFGDNRRIFHFIMMLILVCLSWKIRYQIIFLLLTVVFNRSFFCHSNRNVSFLLTCLFLLDHFNLIPIILHPFMMFIPSTRIIITGIDITIYLWYHLLDTKNKKFANQ